MADEGASCFICFHDDRPLADLVVDGRHADKASPCRPKHLVCFPCWRGYVDRAGFTCPICHGSLKRTWMRKTAALYLRDICLFLVFWITSMFEVVMEGCTVATVLYMGGYDFPLFYYVAFMAAGLRIAGRPMFTKVYGDFTAYAGAVGILMFAAGCLLAVFEHGAFMFVLSVGVATTFIMTSTLLVALFKTLSPWYMGFIPLSAYRMRATEPAAQPALPTPPAPPRRYNLRPRV